MVFATLFKRMKAFVRDIADVKKSKFSDFEHYVDPTEDPKVRRVNVSFLVSETDEEVDGGDMYVTREEFDAHVQEFKEFKVDVNNRFDKIEVWQKNADVRFDKIEEWQRKADIRFDNLENAVVLLANTVNDLAKDVKDIKQFIQTLAK